MQPDKDELDRIIDIALLEDIGGGDVTSIVTIPEGTATKFYIRAREELVMCGGNIVTMVFSKVSKGTVTTKVKIRDGEIANANDILIEGFGPARAVMSGERVALNLLRQMCGVATITKQYVKEIQGTNAKLLDTRKTIPGIRSLQKYAVTIGGGCNHRFGLYDGILIKDNHIAICGGVEEAIKMARKNISLVPYLKNQKIEVECDAIYQVHEAVKFGADIILLDNMDISELEEAVKIVGGRIPIEASGGVKLSTISSIAKTGVDFISAGSITNNPADVDIALDMQ